MSPTIFSFPPLCTNLKGATWFILPPLPPSLPPVPQPDPNTPRPEGRQIIPVKGEPLGVVSNWPPALQAALARWGASQAKSPALTTLDVTGKPLYTLTYGRSHRLKWHSAPYMAGDKEPFQANPQSQIGLL